MISGVGAFFGSFQAKDWVTAVLAVAAIVISIITVVQNNRHHPRARMKYRWAKKLTGHDGVIMVELKTTNEGSASAPGFRLDIDNARDQYASHRFAEDNFVQGREEAIVVPVQPTVRGMKADGSIRYRIEDGTGGFKLLRSKVTVQVAGYPTKTLRAPNVELWWKKEIAEQERKLQELENG
jgi:low affinity Fe/Cu permease